MNDENQMNVSKIDVGKLYEQKKTSMLGQTNEGQSAGFKEVLSGFMSDVNDLQNKADDKIGKLASGEVKDLHEVMVAVTEADTSFKIMMEMRNKLMEAYREVMKMGGGG